MNMTVQPRCAKADAIGPDMWPGIVPPCTKRTFQPLSETHSYTYITPYAASTSRAPGKRLCGYASAIAWISDRDGSCVSFGEGMAYGRIDLYKSLPDLSFCPTTKIQHRLARLYLGLLAD